MDKFIFRIDIKVYETIAIGEETSFFPDVMGRIIHPGYYSPEFKCTEEDIKEIRAGMQNVHGVKILGITKEQLINNPNETDK